MKKTFYFKMDYNNNGYLNDVTVDVSLKNDIKNRPCFSASACVWNKRHTDCYICGQCLDELNISDPNFIQIKALWKRNHLNDLNAGTERQETAIKDALVSGKIERYDYTKACDYLKSIGLYEDTYEGKPYKYGYGWCYRPISSDDLEQIKSILC